MKINPERTQINDLVVKIHEPAKEIKRVGLLIHGFTGDESSMWVFTNQLSDDWLLIAPRAPYPSKDVGLGGYSWVDQSIKSWPVYQDFLPAVSILDNLVEELDGRYPETDFSRISLVGFSQGAAMSFVYTNAHSGRVERLGMLSGFLPDSSEGFISEEAWKKLKVFIGHGEKDDIVPVEMAYTAYQTLVENGVDAEMCHLCLTDVGHRLGSACFSAFSKFMEA